MAVKACGRRWSGRGDEQMPVAGVAGAHARMTGLSVRVLRGIHAASLQRGVTLGVTALTTPLSPKDAIVWGQRIIALGSEIRALDRHARIVTWTPYHRAEGLARARATVA